MKRRRAARRQNPTAQIAKCYAYRRHPVHHRTIDISLPPPLRLAQESKRRQHRTKCTNKHRPSRPPAVPSHATSAAAECAREE
eukprot:5146074-Prymnesium_polylepis.1